jgi:purine nucleosidase
VEPRPLILDVDTGVDDALALLYAVASPEVSLIAATAVTGNVLSEQAAINTLTVLELAGRPDVEVAVGAERPLVREVSVFTEVHGERGLGLAAPAAPAGSPSERHAVRAIVDTARQRPGEVLLVATGPLTNIALALSEEPRLPDLLAGFALMGGAFASGGNVTPRAEANIWMDPEAAKVVFRAFAGQPLGKLPLCVGLDVTERVRMTQADLDRVCSDAPRSPLARFLQDAVPFYIDFYARTRAFDGACMHDPLAVAVAIDPSLVGLETTRVEIETEGEWTRGETVTDLIDIRRSPWPGEWEEPDNARVALQVDAEAFTDRFVDRLKALVASLA